jgi:hypothetical protein
MDGSRDRYSFDTHHAIGQCCFGRGSEIQEKKFNLHAQAGLLALLNYATSYFTTKNCLCLLRIVISCPPPYCKLFALRIDVKIEIIGFIVAQFVQISVAHPQHLQAQCFAGPTRSSKRPDV